EKDYYNGLVSEATPEQRAGVDARRGEGAADQDRSGGATGRREVEGVAASAGRRPFDAESAPGSVRP
ncbi:MAG: hypothetical protein ACJ756_00690, partial [Solirubrobacterales bacterium]